MQPPKLPSAPARDVTAYIAIAGLFAIWGMAQWDYGIVFPQFAQFFGFSASQTGWTQALFSITYCIFALPVALFHRRFGYKLGVTAALSVISLGPFLIYPAITAHSSLFFIGAVIMLGIGWSALETSLNPLAVELGPCTTAVRRLNFVQAFYPVGLVAGYLVTQRFLMSFYQHSGNELAQIAASPYVVVGVLVLFLAFAIDRVRFPTEETNVNRPAGKVRDEIRTLLSNAGFRLGLASLFCCILAQATILGAPVSYIAQQLPGAPADLAGRVILWSCVLIGIGRFAGTALMYRFDPNRMLLWGMSACIACIVPAVAFGGVGGLGCLMGTNLFLAVAYPTIFATAIRDLGALTKTASGLLVTAAGMASVVSPIVMNFTLTITTSRAALVLTVPCFVVIIGAVAAIQRAAGKTPAEKEHVAVLAP